MNYGAAMKKVWTTATLLPPKHYERRNTKRKNFAGYSNWETCDWQSIIVKSWNAAELLITKWNQESSANGYGWEYKLPLHCERCYTCVNETYPSMGLSAEMIGKHVCLACHNEGTKLMQEQSKMNCVKCLAYTKKSYGPAGQMVKCSTCYAIEQSAVIAKAKATGTNPVRAVGSMWKLDKANAPFQSEQWGYQGTAKLPYVITHYFNKVDGSTTQDGWACSCMSFTQNVPRTPCKHILNVMLNEGKTPSGASAKAAKVSALLTDEDAKAFDKWKREQAEKGEVKPSAGAELQLFGAQGRKFR